MLFLFQSNNLLKTFVFFSFLNLNTRINKNLPKKIISTEQFVISRIALVGERRAAVRTADARGVPGPLQHMEQELVQDGLLAAGAGHSAACLPTSWGQRKLY